MCWFIVSIYSTFLITWWLAKWSKSIDKKNLTQAGLEPTISCSVGRRLIHWATEPWFHNFDQTFFYFFRALYYANLRSKALSGELSIIISKNRIFNHVMAIRMITWISFIRRREFRNARGIFNQCNRYFCTWKSNVLLHNFRTRQSEFISLSSTLEIHSHTFILQENVVEYLINDRFHDITVKFTTKLRRECNWKKSLNWEVWNWKSCSKIGKIFQLKYPIDY